MPSRSYGKGPPASISVDRVAPPPAGSCGERDAPGRSRRVGVAVAAAAGEAALVERPGEDREREDRDAGRSTAGRGRAWVQKPMACARRLTSEPRFSRSASIGPAGQVGVEEQPGDALAVVVPAVVQQGQQARQPLDDEPSSSRNAAGTRGPAPGGGYGGGELVVPDHGADLGRGHAEQLRGLAPSPATRRRGVGQVGIGERRHGHNSVTAPTPRADGYRASPATARRCDEWGPGEADP